ncbi:hypothetical protein [Arthrobacter sp. ES3-54]|uniref:hypothetical protein n=1 Tax=Arthrobacter sp. ES3-54 TaxID=1502991 RepID=UPI0024066437|nr:hypothetical protein [Arthrobacter sp. ES3-54]MDF9751528.1 hypothetical protein [Arthrobacter sp. ES3-54]
MNRTTINSPGSATAARTLSTRLRKTPATVDALFPESTFPFGINAVTTETANQTIEAE